LDIIKYVFDDPETMELALKIMKKEWLIIKHLPG